MSNLPKDEGTVAQDDEWEDRRNDANSKDGTNPSGRFSLVLGTSFCSDAGGQSFLFDF